MSRKGFWCEVHDDWFPYGVCWTCRAKEPPKPPKNYYTPKKTIPGYDKRYAEAMKEILRKRFRSPSKANTWRYK